MSADVVADLPDRKAADLFIVDFGLTYGNPDFLRFAESLGATGQRAESPAHLGQLLAHCLDAPGVHVIECPVD